MRAEAAPVRDCGQITWQDATGEEAASACMRTDTLGAVLNLSLDAGCPNFDARMPAAPPGKPS